MKVKDIEWKVQFDDGGEFMVTYDFNEKESLSVTKFISTGIESSYFNGELFWLASGGYDVREYPEFTIQEAIAFVKQFATTWAGD